MAEQKIPFQVAYKKNDNEHSHAYGKYYPEAYSGSTLSLRGLIERVAFDQSVYSRDIVEGVIQKLTTVMVELLQQGQPVKWDGLGTFQPKVESTEGGVTKAQLQAGTNNVNQDVAGIHIRFIPENSKGEEITSRKFKEQCVLENVGVITITKVGTAPNIKRYQTLTPMETWRQQNPIEP